MRKFIAQSLGGKFSLGEDRDRFAKFLIQNDKMRFEIIPLLPESRKQRNFYHGAVIPLWAYCDGKEYRDDVVLAEMHEVAKLEFSPHIVYANGKKYQIGQSTKKKLNQGFVDKIIDYLEENYGIDRTKVLNPKDYKYWKDAVFPNGGPENFIDYLIEAKILYDRNSASR